MSSETFRNKIKILGTKIERGSRVTLEFDVAKLHTRNSIKVPIFIERAQEDGPVLLLLGGVHGDELNGVEIVRRIIRQKINRPTRGTVIAIPVFNIFGFINTSRSFPDGRDLNRVFPGSPKGSLASQFAHQFREDIMPHVDYVIDFHAGGADRVNVAQTRCLISDKKTYKLAKAFGAPFIVNSNFISKSIRKTFNDLGKPSLLFEGGKSMLYDEAAIKYGVQGTKNVMRALKMRKFRKRFEKKSVVIRKSKWLRAPYSGMFHVKVDNGSWVTKKTVMGIVTDPFGTFEKNIYAPFDCYVFCSNVSPIVNRGDAVFHVSVETGEKPKKKAKKKRLKSTKFKPEKK